MVILAIGGDYVDYEDQEIAQRIGIEDAHTVTRGEGVRVAVLDSGVDPGHEALQGHLVAGGYDFVDDDPDPWEEANGLDDDADGITDEGYGHGSMVAGIIALVAPEAEILPIRILNDEGRSDAFLISKAISYALNEGAHVLNMSFGVPFEIESIEHQIDLAKSMGAVVVSGAGNENREEPAYFPAIEEEALMVTALDSLDRKADFADWHSHVLVSAPGTGVRSAYPGDDWGLGSGCSFAVPFVSGEAALILSLWPDTAPEDVEEQIQLAVEPIYEIEENEPYDGQLGRGRIFLPDAVGASSSSVSGDVAGVVGVLSAFPNPSQGGLRLEIPFTQGKGARLSIFDASGRLVYSRVEQARIAAWDGRDQNGEAVATGVYYVRVREGNRSHQTAVRILR
jgi:subtilisin family serine protease